MRNISQASIALGVLLFMPLSLAVDPAPAQMKAVRVEKYGGPEVMKVENIPVPEPKEDEIRVHVVAAGVNPVDAAVRSGMFTKFFKTKLPLVPGCDIAGVVEKGGAKVGTFKVGDPVFACLSVEKG